MKIAKLIDKKNIDMTVNPIHNEGVGESANRSPYLISPFNFYKCRI